jgi:hypothetical protein
MARHPNTPSLPVHDLPLITIARAQAGAPGSCRLAFAGDDSPRLRSHPSELIIQRIANLTYMEI